MKKTLLLAACAVALSACGIDYQGSTKFIFEGRIVDQDGNPLKNIPVRTHVSDGDTSDIIGIDVTDSNGNYQMMFPGASENVEFAVGINFGPDEYNNPESPYSTTTILNLPQDQVKDEDYRIDFGDTPLYIADNSVLLHIDFIDNPEIMDIVQKIALVGLVDYQKIDYNFEAELPDPVQGWDPYYFQSDYLVAPNQVLTLRYMLHDSTIHEVQIPVGGEDLTYTFEF